MRKMMLAAAAGLAAMTGAAFAQDETAPAPSGECALGAEAPEMPDAKTATAEDRSATVQKIKDFQAALNEYRACLTATADNEEMDVEKREAALKEFNRTVAVETKMVEDWQKFDKKYQKANK